jgi:glucose/arabinose dehydrogenase
MNLRGIGAGIAMGVAAVGIMPHNAQAQLVDSERIITGLNRPLYVTHAPGDFERIFILEQPGRIRIYNIQTGQLQAQSFLDIQTIVNDSGNERGLLGLAFHPDFQNNGRFFVSYTGSGGDNFIAEYGVNDPADNVANAGQVQQIIRYDQPFSNHNGGWIAFGPDGYLYAATGDGGSANDPQNNAQNLSRYLGKMLRIDIDGDDYPTDSGRNYAIPASNPLAGSSSGLEEIWAYGLRNAWRCSFDRETGDLWIGDVGQDAREEINFQFGGLQALRNYGWRCKEGPICTGLSGCNCGDFNLTDPITSYPQTGGRCSVTAGYVYRGDLIPELDGAFWYGDYCSAAIYTIRYDGSTVSDFTVRSPDLNSINGGSISWVASFGEDAYGEMYICDLFGGEVFAIIPQDPTPRTDCNENGIEDGREITDGSAVDADDNGVIDICEEPVNDCQGDFDGNGLVDGADFGAFGAAFGSMAGDASYNTDADFDGNGVIDGADFGAFGAEFGRDDCLD